MADCMSQQVVTLIFHMQVAFWSCAMSIVILGLTIMLVVMAYARHKRLIFIPGSHHMVQQ